MSNLDGLGRRGKLTNTRKPYRHYMCPLQSIYSNMCSAHKACWERKGKVRVRPTYCNYFEPKTTGSQNRKW